MNTKESIVEIGSINHPFLFLCYVQGPQGEPGPPGQQGMPGPHVSFFPFLCLYLFFFFFLTLSDPSVSPALSKIQLFCCFFIPLFTSLLVFAAEGGPQSVLLAISIVQCGAIWTYMMLTKKQSSFLSYWDETHCTHLIALNLITLSSWWHSEKYSILESSLIQNSTPNIVASAKWPLPGKIFKPADVHSLGRMASFPWKVLVGTYPDGIQVE